MPFNASPAASCHACVSRPGAIVRKLARLGLSAGIALWIAGCASPSYRAPVEDRNVGSGRSASVSASQGSTADATKPALPGSENAGKPGYYTVKAGDTLLRVALETGQNWRDLQKWNNLANPNVLEVGQVLRVVPPDADASAASARPVTTAKVEPRPIDAKPPVAASAPVANASAPATGPAAAPPPAPAASSADDDLNWMWPAAGPVISAFDEARNKGVAISGKEGDPVYAAADGRVVYAGSGLRGYGNLVIIKHNATYLTAYAHNKVLLVKEDQPVRRGQKIAEMGASDSDRVQLHFEIRRQGKPIDPTRLLPPR